MTNAWRSIDGNSTKGIDVDVQMQRMPRLVFFCHVITSVWRFERESSAAYVEKEPDAGRRRPLSDAKLILVNWDAILARDK